MNDMSLSRLYRRLTDGPSLLAADVEPIVDAVAGARPDPAVAIRLSTSSAHADLARFMRALGPESEAIAQAMPRNVLSHPNRRRERPANPAERRAGTARLRWAGGLAACLAVALGVGLWHGNGAPGAQWNGTVAAAATTRYQTDRIFTTRDEIFAASGDASPNAPARGGDRVFKSNFQG